MNKKQVVMLDVYEVLDQLGINREAINFLGDPPPEGANEVSAMNVQPE